MGLLEQNPLPVEEPSTESTLVISIGAMTEEAWKKLEAEMEEETAFSNRG